MRIAVTGNMVIDALFWVRDEVMSNTGRRASLDKRYVFLDGVQKMILVTGQRREIFGDGFNRICAALARIALDHPDMQVVYPVHLNPNVSKPVNRMLSGIANIELIDPKDSLPFVYLIDSATIILTDSGGIQEEAPSLGKPMLGDPRYHRAAGGGGGKHAAANGDGRAGDSPGGIAPA